MTGQDVRSAFPVLAEKAYLNTGTYGPLPRCAAEALQAALGDEIEAGRSRLGYHTGLHDLRDVIRGKLATLIGAGQDEVAITRATTEGTNLVVSALRLGPGDEIVTSAEEHHAFRTALYVPGAKVTEVRLAGLAPDDVVARLAEAITSRTRLIALSHVIWLSGQTLPIGEIAKLGPPVLLDAAQSVGAIPVDVADLGCHFMVFPGQKWLLGPDGSGGLFVRRDCQDLLNIPLPSSYGHHIPAQGDDIPRNGATRYDPGPIARPLLLSWLAALDFAEELGPARFQAVQDLAAKFRVALAEKEQMIDHPDPATLVSFVPRGDPDAVNQALSDVGVVVRTLPSTGWIRASVGWWNDENDLDRLVTGLG